MESVIGDSFSLNICLMKALLLYPCNELTALHRLKVYVMYFLISTPVPIFSILFLLFEENKDADAERTANNAFVLVQSVCCFCKWSPFIFRGEKIKKCIHFFDTQNVTQDLNNKQKRIIDESIKTCRNNSKIYLTFLIQGFLIWAVRPLLAEHIKLPIDLWLPYNLHHSKKLFYIIYLIVIFEILYLALATAVVDPLIGGLVCLTISHLKILKDNLQFLDLYANDNIVNKICNCCYADEKLVKITVIHNKIRKIVTHHNSILNFVNVFKESFSAIVFCQFMGSSFEICICCFQLTMITPLTFSFFSLCLYIGIMVTQIYFYCYYGTLLFEENNTIVDAIYAGNWYEYDIQSQKKLLVLIERSKMPMIITAGKILDLSLNTFTMILRRSYSLLAVLKNY